jgi:hypothetical protein
LILVIFLVFRSRRKGERRKMKAKNDGLVMRLNTLPLEANEKRMTSAMETNIAIGTTALPAGVLVTDQRIFLQPLSTAKIEIPDQLISIPLSDAKMLLPARKHGVFSLSYQDTRYSIELPQQGIDCLKGFLSDSTVKQAEA